MEEYCVSEEPGFFSYESDQTTPLSGERTDSKKCSSCQTVLEYRLTHRPTDRSFEDYLIGDGGTFQVIIHERVELVVCPNCRLLYDLSVYKEWLFDQEPRCPS